MRRNWSPVARRVLGRLKKSLPGMISCREFDEFLDAYLEGSLPAPQHRKFLVHVWLCPHCDRYLETYRRAREMAVDALSAEDEADLRAVPEELVQAILEARQEGARER